jgi:hypothetical protein
MDSSSGTAPAPATEGGKRSKWMAHVKATMKANKGKSLKQVLKMAGKTYKKSAKGGMSPAIYGGKRRTSKGAGMYGAKRLRTTRKNSRK